MATHAEGKGPAPEELRFASRVERWGDPWGKGWMEWPAGMVERAAVATNVYKCFKAYAAAENKAKWANANMEAFNIITWVKKARGDYG